MSTMARMPIDSDHRTMLTNAITILERLGIIDFNGHFSARLPDGKLLINTGRDRKSVV